MPPVRTNSKISFAAASSKAAKSSKPTGVTKVTKSRGKLRRFAEMPKNVQQRIWEFAASPDGPLKLNPKFVTYVGGGGAVSERGFFSRTSKAALIGYTESPTRKKNMTTFEIYQQDREKARNKAQARATAPPRLRVKDVCSLSRQVVLEAWKTDVAAIVDKGSEAGIKRKYKVERLLDGLISGLQGVDDNVRDTNRARHMAIPKMKVITSFPRFSKLPYELRRRIWEFAAIPKGAIDLEREFLAKSTTAQDFFKATSEVRLPSFSADGGMGRATVRATAAARTRLMRICSLSREVTIVAFKGDIQHINELEYVGYHRTRVYDKEDKKKIVDLLDGLLGELKSRDDERGLVVQALDNITGSRVVVRSFKRFPQLPKEVQMMIWEHASIPSSPIELSFRFFRALNFHRLGKGFFMLISKKHLPDHISSNTIARRKIRANALNRTKLLHLCPFSRQVMLEIWKKEVALAGPRIERSHPGFAPLANECITEITKILDRLIMQLERGNRQSA